MSLITMIFVFECAMRMMTQLRIQKLIYILAMILFDVCLYAVSVEMQSKMALITMILCDVCLDMFCPYALSVDNSEGDVSDHNNIMRCLFR